MVMLNSARPVDWYKVYEHEDRLPDKTTTYAVSNISFSDGIAELFKQTPARQGSVEVCQLLRPCRSPKLCIHVLDLNIRPITFNH